MMYRILASALATVSLGGCQHSTQAVPAVLADGSDAAMDRLRTHLAAAMGKANVTLGPGDPTTQSSVTVLPPPLGEHETRSPAAPTVFRLLIMDNICYAEREDSGARIELQGVPCRAL